MKKIAVFFTILAVCIQPLFSFGCTSGQRVTEYKIECSYEDGVVSGKEEVNFCNFSEVSLSEIKFNLFANAFRKDAKYTPVALSHVSVAYPDGMSYGSMEILSVKSYGKDMQFEIGGEDSNVLVVTLSRELFPDECISIEIEYKITLAKVIARTGVNADTVNLANFYPILCGLDKNGFYECVYYSTGDPYYSDCSNYSVEFTTDKKYVVASSGEVKNKVEEDGKITYSLSVQNARSFAIVMSEKFKVMTDTSTGTEINYYYYNDDQPSTSLEYGVKAVKLFNEKFGKYPYKTYAITQTKFVQGGMEFPALVMISDMLEPSAYGEVIAHETAHQWWQTTVGNNEIEYPFLDEGLAEYSVVIFYENYSEYGFTRASLREASDKTYKIYCSVFEKLYGNIDTSMLRSLGQYSGEYEYVNIAYVKSCIMYDILRQTLGDDDFFNGLKKYYNQYKFKNAIPDDLVGIYERMGEDTNGFFESFFTGKVIL